jgi:hypothetical protein
MYCTNWCLLYIFTISFFIYFLYYIFPVMICFADNATGALWYIKQFRLYRLTTFGNNQNIFYIYFLVKTIKIYYQYHAQLVFCKHKNGVDSFLQIYDFNQKNSSSKFWLLLLFTRLWDRIVIIPYQFIEKFSWNSINIIKRSYLNILFNILWILTTILKKSSCSIYQPI